MKLLDFLPVILGIDFAFGCYIIDYILNKRR